jgi:hypothetical protein
MKMKLQFLIILLSTSISAACATMPIMPVTDETWRPEAPTVTDVHRQGCAKLCEDPGVGSTALYLYSDLSWPSIYCVCANGRHFHMGATFEWLEQAPVEPE